MIKVLIFLLFSQISSAEESRKYIQVGENPVNPGLILKGEKIFPVGKDTFLTTLDRNGRKHTGWISNGYHFVGKLENYEWRAIRIYECGNPILNPRIILHGVNRSVFNPKLMCQCDEKEWFYWTAGPGLAGYGGGAREKLPMGIGGGLIVIDLFKKSDSKNRKCKIIKKGLIGLASAGIGWLIGNALYKPGSQRANSGSQGSSGGPGPVPPNGLALSF